MRTQSVAACADSQQLLHLPLASDAAFVWRRRSVASRARSAARSAGSRVRRVATTTITMR